MKKINSIHIILFFLYVILSNSSIGQTSNIPVYNPNVDSYRIVAISNDSLESISNTISVEKPYALYAPNAFSPDGDGINDFFNVAGQGLTDYVIEIYNRWGQMVFIANDINEKWDGTFKNKKVPAGTYVYKIKSKDFGTELRIIKSGTVSLIR